MRESAKTVREHCSLRCFRLGDENRCCRAGGDFSCLVMPRIKRITLARHVVELTTIWGGNRLPSPTWISARLMRGCRAATVVEESRCWRYGDQCTDGAVTPVNISRNPSLARWSNSREALAALGSRLAGLLPLILAASGGLLETSLPFLVAFTWQRIAGAVEIAVEDRDCLAIVQGW